MGALDYAGEAAYGAISGFQRGEQLQREKESHETDQAIRKERLRQDEELFPLRKKTGELQAEDAAATLESNRTLRPIQQRAAEYNLNIAEMNQTQAKKLIDAADKAKVESDAIQKGVRDFWSTGNAQDFMDQLGTVSEKHKGGTAVTDAQGNITINTADGKNPMTFRHGATYPDGTPMPPKDQLAHFAEHVLDPLAAIKKRYGFAQDVAKEGAKQSAITQRETTVGVNRDQAAANRALTTRTAADHQKEVGLINQSVDAILKQRGYSGEFAAGAANPDDAPLVGHARVKARELVDSGKTAQDAALTAVEAVRKEYSQLSSAATQIAAQLQDTNIDYRDIAAVTKAADGGNANAKSYLAVLELARKRMSDSVANYLQKNVRTPKKK